MLPADVEKARQHLKEKNFHRAVKELKTASRDFPEEGQIHFMLALAYVLLGKRENSRSFFILAESPLRKAITLQPLTEKYHDLLVEIKALTGKLDQLSCEYRRKKDKSLEPLYGKMLKKISTVSVLYISPKEKRKKVKHKGYYLIHYLLMPAVAAGATGMWLLQSYTPLRNMLSVVVVVYVAGRVFLIPLLKKYR